MGSCKKEREKLIQENLHLVDSIVQKIVRKYGGLFTESVEELRSIGREALVEAVERYDPSKGATFSTFAYYKIRGKIIDHIFPKRHAFTYQKQKLKALRLEKLGNIIMESFSEEKLPDSLNETIDKIINVTESLVTAYCLQNLALRLDEEIEKRGDLYEESPEDIVNKKEEYTLLYNYINELPENEKRLIEMLYFENLTLSEISQKLNISISWVSRLHTTILQKLRKKFQKSKPNLITSNTIHRRV